MAHIKDLDAVAIVETVAKGEVSASEIVEAAIERVQAVDPQLNVLASDLFDDVRRRAAQPVSGPLAGVPTLIKDLLPVAGQRLMAGCRALKDYVAAETSPYAAHLYAAGLMPIGRSTTPEFGFTATTEPLLTGPTRNPWDINRSSGGSSGGAAVAVAAGIVPVAHASDGGGSIRIPASACGVVGLKASRGRLIDNGRNQGAISISVDGCVSRTVRDTALWLDATQRRGDDRRFSPLPRMTGPSARRLRIGFHLESISGVTPHEDVARAVTRAATQLESLGHSVQPFTYGIDGAAFSQAFTLNWAAYAKTEIEAAMRVSPSDAPVEDRFEALGLGLKALYEAAPPGAHEAAVATLNAVGATYARAFDEVDVVVSPVLATPTVPLGALGPHLPLDQFAAVVAGYVAYTPLHNAAGAPALSLPLGIDAQGAPIGVMFAAKPGGEDTLLALAFELEEAMPWAARRPAVHA